MPSSIFRPILCFVATGMLAGCSAPSDRGTARALPPAADSARRDSVARARQDSVNRTMPGYVVDSILPVAEQVRRFAAQLREAPVTELQGASPSRDALVKRFVQAVVAADSADLLAMALSAREFIDLVYPESPATHPPYQQDPALVWRTIQNPSVSGFKRLVRRAGGIQMTLAGYSCAPAARQGENRLWANCQLRLVGAKGDTTTHRFFGTILERHGRFKIISFKNEF